MACALLIGAGALSGCKPTEKNYKAAYDAAVAKRTAAASTADDLTDGHTMQREGGPRSEVLNGDTLMIRTERLTGFGAGADAGVKRYNLVVASYKMPANAEAQAAALKADGWEARVLRTGSDTFYVVAAQSDNREDIAVKLKAFRKRYPKMQYVGMPDGPVVEEAMSR